MKQNINEMYLSSGVRSPNLASSIHFSSKGPTAGVLNVSELPKETITTESTVTTEADETDMTASTDEVLHMSDLLLEHFCLQRHLRNDEFILHISP